MEEQNGDAVTIDVPAEAPAPAESVPTSDTRTERMFTKDEVEAIRRQEKDKLYDRINKLQEQVEVFNHERDEQKRLAEEISAKEADERRQREEAEMSAKELLLKKEDEFQQRINTAQEEWEQKFSALQSEAEAQKALLEQERRFQELESYKSRRISEEQDNIMPELTRRAVAQVHQLAKRKKPFFLYFSQTSPHEPVVPSKPFQGKSGIAPVADFVMETDWSAGQVIKAVDDAGIADNTILIFTADNGHSHYTGWPDLIKAGHQPSGPYRGHKGDIWEGGHRVPFIVRWPGKTPADRRSNQLVSLTDLYATFADLLGRKLPGNGAEDSVSFLPALQGDTRDTPRASLVSHSNHGEFAYREGPWKLVFRNALPNRNKSRGRKRIVELYNLQDDVDESDNLATQRPEVVKRLSQKLRDLIARGASRSGVESRNDTRVRHEITQTKRWGDPME